MDLMMSAQEASEIVASCDCPNCGTTAYLNVMQLGENLVCGSCGETYAAPRAPGARASKTLWGPRAAVPQEAPTATTAEESPKEYLARVRSQTCYTSARGLLLMIIGGAVVVGMVVSAGAVFGNAGRSNMAVVWGLWLAVVALIMMVAYGVHSLACVVLDIADMAAERNRQK
jgi:hypothetical protein